MGSPKPSERIAQIEAELADKRRPRFDWEWPQIQHDALVMYLDEQAAQAEAKGVCECGHSKDEHPVSQYGAQSYCMVKLKVGPNNDFCPCEGFRERGSK